MQVVVGETVQTKLVVTVYKGECHTYFATQKEDQKRCLYQIKKDVSENRNDHRKNKNSLSGLCWKYPVYPVGGSLEKLKKQFTWSP